MNCGQRLAEPRVDFQHALGLAPEPPLSARRAGFWDQRGPLITFAGIAAIVIALGVGIVIGRGNGGAPAAKATVLTVTPGAPAAATAGSTALAAPAAATSVTETWPASSSGWTVELSTLPKSSAQSSDVTAAESAATSKGALAVGVLIGDNHGGTPTGTYVIYSGHYSTQTQAQAAKAKLKRSFPNAIVLHVTPSGTSGSSSSASAQLRKLAKLSGAAASNASKKLPSTLATGGTPPPKDNKAPGGGSGSGACIGAC